MKILLIANPAAGTFKKAHLDKVTNYLSEKGAKVTVMLTQKGGDATTFAANVKKGEYDVVTAYGGDGTLNEVINGLAEKDTPLGLIPAGTVNVFALETKIPFNQIKACDVILKNNVVSINLGRADDKYFVLMVSAGFDAHVAYNIHGGLKSLFGKMGFVLHGIYLLIFYRFPKIKITADGETHYGYTVIISNMKLYAGNLYITENASFYNNDFEICILKNKGVVSVVKFLISIVLNRHHKNKALSFIKAKDLKLECDSDCCIQVDGDGHGRLMNRIEIVENALKVVIPET
ncbi:diacylglycerol/lipid kinase family protein [Thermodesulfobacteriota bacterium]